MSTTTPPWPMVVQSKPPSRIQEASRPDPVEKKGHGGCVAPLTVGGFAYPVEYGGFDLMGDVEPLLCLFKSMVGCRESGDHTE